jgi:MoxR-like ATPase
VADRFAPALEPPPTEGGTASFADQTDRRTYVFTDDIIFAVNVALATYRPLLVFGPPGVGKSSLAREVRRELKWRYYEEVVTSRTEAQDLLWQTDMVKRLADSQAGGALGKDIEYVMPGVFWWAFRPDSAAQVAAGARVKGRHDADQEGDRAVVLIDEIDKADPDIPNNLLVPLGSLTFEAPSGPVTAKRDAAPLVFITTNNERDLPPAFIRRCVVLNLPGPTKDHLLKVASAHFGVAPDGDTLYGDAAELFLEVVANKRDRNPGTAEYVDFVRACLDLDIHLGGKRWDDLRAAILEKRPDPEGTKAENALQSGA